MAYDRLIRLVAVTAMLGSPACAVAMADAHAPPPAYAPLDIADDYAWIDEADALWEAIGEAPPDYAFVFEGTAPWAWETGDGHQIVVEDAGEGGIRSYYFAPGEDSPFLAVEPGASFGFAAGAVAMVYGPDGGALPRGEWGTHLDRAMQLFARAQLLERAMVEPDRRGVDADAWNDASGLILGFMTQWDAGQRRYPGWRAHRDSAEAATRRQHLERERDRRRGEAGQFARWRQGGFQGKPPHGFEPHRAGPRNGRPPQPGRPKPGVGRPERPDIGVTRPRPAPDTGVPRHSRPAPDTGVPRQPHPAFDAGVPRRPRPRPAPPARGSEDKFPVEMPFVDGTPAPVRAPRPERPERPRPVPASPRPSAPAAAAPVYTPHPAPPRPAYSPPTPKPRAAPPRAPRPTPQSSPRPRTQKLDPVETPS